MILLDNSNIENINSLLNRTTILYKERKSLIFISLFYIILIILMTGIIGTGHMVYFGNEDLFFWAPDSKDYRQLAEFYSFGDSNPPSNDSILLRPYLYPAFLSIYKVIGIGGFQYLQIILNVLSIFFLYNSILLLTNKKYISIIFSAILAITPTFNLIVFYALTETLTIFILSLFIYFLTKGYINKEIRNYIFAGMAISLLLCIKGNFLPFFFIYLMFLYYNLIKIKNKKKAILILIIISIPSPLGRINTTYFLNLFKYLLN